MHSWHMFTVNYNTDLIYRKLRYNTCCHVIIVSKRHKVSSYYYLVHKNGWNLMLCFKYILVNKMYRKVIHICHSVTIHTTTWQQVKLICTFRSVHVFSLDTCFTWKQCIVTSIVTIIEWSFNQSSHVLFFCWNGNSANSSHKLIHIHFTNIHQIGNILHVQKCYLKQWPVVWKHIKNVLQMLFMDIVIHVVMVQ